MLKKGCGIDKIRIKKLLENHNIYLIIYPIHFEYYLIKKNIFNKIIRWFKYVYCIITNKIYAECPVVLHKDDLYDIIEVDRNIVFERYFDEADYFYINNKFKIDLVKLIKDKSFKMLFKMIYNLLIKGYIAGECFKYLDLDLEYLKTDYGIPPCETLKEELEYNKISKEELSAAADIPLQVIEDILNNRKPITPEIAEKLEKVLDINADFWLRLQDNYKADLIRNNIDKNDFIMLEIGGNLNDEKFEDSGP